MEDTSNSKRGLISTRGKFSSWDDFIETANQYFTQVKKWEGAGITHGDFFLGQPRDPPKPEMLSALWGSLQKGSKPDTPTDYFGYNFLQKEAQQAIPEMIRKHRKLEVDPEDCMLTNGALAALLVSLQVLTDPGDEVIMITPWYFFYPAMCELLGIQMVGVPALPENHDLDLEAIDRAITPLTRAILINSPNNPTGKVYSEEVLRDLGELLAKRSSGRDSPIFLISDEAYCRIVFEGNFAPSPVGFYDYSLLVYTFGKSTLAPGERLGYIALSPRMKPEDREAMRESITRACMTGYSRPSSTTSHALESMDGVLIDIGQMEARRDKLFFGLSKHGYDISKPQGSFYMMLRCPRGLSGIEFAKELMQEKVLVVPGEVMGLPGHIRLSLTCSDAMIEFALPVFKRLLKESTFQHGINHG